MYFTVFKLLKELPGIINTAGMIAKELKGLSSQEYGKANLTNSGRLTGLEKAMELQSKLNEQFENQMKIMQAVLEKTQKMLRLFTIVSFSAIGLALLAIILFVLRIYE
jgi:hypothetical protein